MARPDITELRVLVVDDNRHFRSIMRTVLRSFDVREVYDVADAVEAFALLKEKDIDLAFVDLEMPVIDGLEFVDLVRRAPDSPSQTLPVIMISGDARRSTVELATKRGADDFLVKPVRPIDVLNRIVAVQSKIVREVDLESA